jgi:MFS family permease
MRLPNAPTAWPGYKWLVVGIFWLICTLNYADRQLIFTVFPLLGEEFKLRDSSLWVLSGSFMWMYALIGPLAGSICDRLRRKTVVLSAVLFWSLTMAATAWARHYWQLVTGVSLGGFAEAFYFPAAMSLIGDYHAVGTRSRAMAVHQSGVYVGSIAGGTLAGLIGQYYGWRPAFRLFGAAGVVVALILLMTVREPMRGMSDENAGSLRTGVGLMEGLREIAGNPAAWLLTVVFMGANFVAMIFAVWMPTFLFREFHMGLAMSGLNGTAYLQVASVLGVVSGGALADGMVRRRRGRKSARMLVQSLGLMCGAPFLFLSGWATTVTMVLAAMIGYGIFKGVYDSNIWAALYDVVPIERRGASVGVMNSLGWLGGAAAQLSIGFASERFGMSTCLSATAAIYLCIGTALFWGARRLMQKDIGRNLTSV